MANALSFADPRLQKPARAVGTMPAPAPLAPPQVANALKPQASFASAPQQPQNRMLGAAVDGFQRGFDPKGWQAGQDKAKTDKSEALKQQITTLQNVRNLPLDQRMQVLPQLAQSMGKQIPPELMQDAAIDQHLALLMGEAGIAPEKPDFLNLGDGAVARVQNGQLTMEQTAREKPKTPIEVDGVLVDPETYEPLYTAPQKPVEKKYDTVQLADGVYRVNQNDPTDKVRVGPAPPKGAGAGGARNPSGLTPYQEVQFQYKLDDLDRELAGNDKKRNSDLATINSSIGLLDSFTSDDGKKKFDETYGNWINPTGEGNDMLNPRVTPGSDRANGMAMLEQIGGRAFLDSIAAMRGTGALSDREGARVAAAATRLMQVTMSDDEARKAATEFRETLQSFKVALEQDIKNSRTSEASRRAQMQAMLGRNPAPEEDDADDDGFIDSLFPADDGGSDEIPEGITPEEWNAMPPEDRALFQ